MQREANAPHAEALRYWLRQSKNMRRTARLAEVGRSTLYEWIDEGFPVPAYAMRKVFRAIPDVAAFAETSGANAIGLVVSRGQTIQSAGDIRDEVMDVTTALGAASDALRKAYANRVIDEGERRTLRTKFDEVIRQAQEMRLALDVPSLKVAL